MASYKDIDTLTKKVTLDGLEKIPASGSEYFTTGQIIDGLQTNALTTTDKTIVGAINEVNGDIFPSEIMDPFVGQELVYDGSKWVNKELPGLEAWVPFGFTFSDFGAYDSVEGDMFFMNGSFAQITQVSSMDFEGTPNGIKNIYTYQLYGYTSSGTISGFMRLPAIKITYYADYSKLLYGVNEYVPFLSIHITTIANLSNAFKCNSMEKCYILAPEATHASEAFVGVNYTTGIRGEIIFIAPKCTDYSSCFNGSWVKTIAIDMNGCVDSAKSVEMFKGCRYLENLSLKNLRVSITLSNSELLTRESMIYLFENAKVVTKMTITLGAKNLAKLSVADRLIATNKGFTLL